MGICEREWSSRVIRIENEVDLMLADSPIDCRVASKKSACVGEAGALGIRTDTSNPRSN